jgi:SMI1 / KNR4 family (SUKH-1)
MADLYNEKKAILPRGYVDFIEVNNGWEGDLGEESGYLMLWKREAIQEFYDNYEMKEFLSDHWFPFGSNGGGEMLCFDLDSGTDRVLLMPFVGMDDEDVMLAYHSFEDIACILREKQRG